MAITRSPRAPSVALDRAVLLAGELWKKEKKTAVSSELVAKAWGYSSVSGVVRSQMGALRQYGLLDGTKDGVRISDLAIEILVQPKGSRERSAALHTAALNPPVFSDIYKAMPDASDDALIAYLITKRGFNQEAAERVICSYRDTIALAGLDEAGYNDPSDEAENERDMGPESVPMERQAIVPRVISGLSFDMPFRGTHLSVRIDTAGQALTREHIERVQAFLKLAADDLDHDGEAD